MAAIRPNATQNSLSWRVIDGRGTAPPIGTGLSEARIDAGSCL